VTEEAFGRFQRVALVARLVSLYSRRSNSKEEQ